MEERKTKKFLVSVKPTIHEKLSDLAWENRLSLNEYLCRLFEKHLEKHDKKND